MTAIDANTRLAMVLLIQAQLDLIDELADLKRNRLSLTATKLALHSIRLEVRDFNDTTKNQYHQTLLDLCCRRNAPARRANSKVLSESSIAIRRLEDIHNWCCELRKLG